MSRVIIYTLEDPRNNEIRYVGKTIQSLSSRLSSHVSKAKCNGKLSHTKAWVKSLLNDGYKPLIKELEVTTDNEWEESEVFYIAYFKMIGINLTNHSSGGDSSNQGSTWSLTNKQKENIKIFHLDRDLGLYLYNAEGVLIKPIKNLLNAANYLNMSYRAVASAYQKQCLLKGLYYIGKSNFKVPAKRVVRQVLVLTNSKPSIFVNAKQAAAHIGIANSTLNKALKQKEYYIKDNYEIQYYECLS